MPHEHAAEIYDQQSREQEMIDEIKRLQDRLARTEGLYASAKRSHGLNDLAREIREINAANGWNVTAPEDWDGTYKVPAIIALIHSEASEALEAFRKRDKENFGEELADTLIRILDCAPGLGIDLDAEVRAKLEKNKTRGYRHGNKVI